LKPVIVGPVSSPTTRAVTAAPASSDGVESTVPHTDTASITVPDVEPGVAEQAVEAAAEAAVEILDIPVKKGSRAPRRISTKDAEQLLDSVLEALPEPTPPGTARARTSRRASSAGLAAQKSVD
jgi:ribonuclease E